LQQVSELLKENPEYYSVWNYRRLIRQHEFPAAAPSDKPSIDQVAAIIKSDLEFLFPLLRSFPKCYWIWNYRLWILDEAKRLLPRLIAHEFWQKELALVGKMLSVDSRNFHGWGYRRHVIQELEDFSADEDSLKQITQAEVDYTTKMIGVNLSNFSAWHNRTKLIQKLLNEKKASDEERKKVLDQGDLPMIPFQSLV
jgi:geranylgeranyl transferase type-2 subunit alpha